jgi:hypothetical protein
MQPFGWGKKLNKEKKDGNGKVKVDEEQKRLELLEEVSRVRKRREDRQKELEEMERLRNEEQRLREAASYGDWQTKEEEFHTDQTRVRSLLRISERREQPIDCLAKNILLIQEADAAKAPIAPLTASRLTQRGRLEAETRDPVAVIESLSLDHLHQLIPDIEAFVQMTSKTVELETSSEKKHDQGYLEYWKAVHTIAEAQRKKLLLRASSSVASMAIHRSLQEDVARLLNGKSPAELDLLQHDVELNLRRGRPISHSSGPAYVGGVTDPAYWEAVGAEINVEKARILASSAHRWHLERALVSVKELRDKAKADRRAGAEDNKGDHRFVTELGLSSGVKPDDHTLQRDGVETGPPDEERDDGTPAGLTETDTHLNEDEEQMGRRDEVTLPTRSFPWSSQHRPRKPRYFNRVRTGFDWNKYNQTHYDTDNPPPKTIHGYKFAIFYPDLIDKNVPPKYFLEATDSPDFALIRFHAGPPYEDIAFRIVNRHWDTDRRSGFRCVFERGMLLLHFNFRRQWYRR